MPSFPGGWLREDGSGRIGLKTASLGTHYCEKRYQNAPGGCLRQDVSGRMAPGGSPRKWSLWEPFTARNVTKMLREDGSGRMGTHHTEGTSDSNNLASTATPPPRGAAARMRLETPEVCTGPLQSHHQQATHTRNPDRSNASTQSSGATPTYLTATPQPLPATLLVTPQVITKSGLGAMSHNIF